MPDHGVSCAPAIANVVSDASAMSGPSFTELDRLWAARRRLPPPVTISGPLVSRASGGTKNVIRQSFVNVRRDFFALNG